MLLSSKSSFRLCKLSNIEREVYGNAIYVFAYARNLLTLLDFQDYVSIDAIGF